MDEATSALDTVSESFIQNTLDVDRQDRTVIIVAHRLSTVINADCIVVLDKHGIAEQGTYNQLLAMRGAFFKLVRSQNAQIIPRESRLANPSQESFLTVSPYATRSAHMDNYEVPIFPSRDSPVTAHLLGAGATQPEKLEESFSKMDIARFVGQFNSQSVFLGLFGFVWAIVTGCCSTVQSYLLARVSKANYTLLLFFSPDVRTA